VQSLDILGFFDSPDNLKTYSISKEVIIEWIYSLQVISSPQAPPTSAGFKGGSFLGPDVDDEFYNQGHLAMTYSALCTLITLGDDLKRVHRKEIISSLKYLQQSDGR
jgi:geranylgeranyl transferase type-1 subunit beta